MKQAYIAKIEKQNAELKAIVTHLITQPLDDESVFNEGLSRLYTSGLSRKQIALVEQFIK